MQALAATSFDRYARYSYTYRLRTEVLDARPLRILDVGDPYGTLAEVFADDFTVSIDLFSEGAPGAPDHQHILGSGFHLPFPDASFDLVTAHDVLEHVPDSGRLSFIRELLRVSAGPVLIAAPFWDPRTVACERLVNTFYEVHNGASLKPLDEHAAEGLPRMEDVIGALARDGVPFVVYSDGWLFHWLAFMMLKAHYVSIGAAASDRATDAAFNELLRERDTLAPHYRRALVLRPPRDAVDRLGPGVDPDATPVDAHTEELEQLAWELARALPRGEDPLRLDSALARWARDARAGAPRNLKTLADSLMLVTEAAREGRRQVQSNGATPHPAVTALVLSGDSAAVERTVKVLRDVDAIADVFLLGRSAPAVLGTIPILTDADDHVLEIATAISAVPTDAALIVDPWLDVDADHIRLLLDSFPDNAACVGFHHAADTATPGAASVQTDGSDVLYVARELLLVRRDVYRAVGGIDGRLRGVLDDVDFGWRLNLCGHRVVSAGPAWWRSRSSGDAPEPSTALLWCWIKNLEIGNLQRALARDILPASLADDGLDVDAFRDLAGLLSARRDVQRARVVDDRTVADRFGTVEYPAPPGAQLGVLLRELMVTPAPVTPAARVVILGDGTQDGRLRMVASALESTIHVRWVDDPRDLERELWAGTVVVGNVASLGGFVEALASWDGVVVGDLAGATPAAVPVHVLQRVDLFLCDAGARRRQWAPTLARLGGSVLGAEDDESIVTCLTLDPSLAGPRIGSGTTVVVDQTARAADLSAVGRFLDEWAALDGRASVVVLVDSATEAFHGFVRDGVDVVLASDRGAQLRVIEQAGVVVRLPSIETSLLGNAVFDALYLGVPAVVTQNDFGADEVAASGAGIVAGTTERELASAARRCLADADVRTEVRYRATEFATAMAAGEGCRAFVRSLQRANRWQGAHRGAPPAVSGHPVVAGLLAAQEAALTRHLTTTVSASVERQLREEYAVRQAEYAALKERLRETERVLAEERAAAERLRRHPAVRALRLLRRLIRRAVT